jgi:hypothetical protein
MIENKLSRFSRETILYEVNVFLVLNYWKAYKGRRNPLDIETIAYNHPWETLLLKVAPVNLIKLGQIFRALLNVGSNFELIPLHVLNNGYGGNEL